MLGCLEFAFRNKRGWGMGGGIGDTGLAFSLYCSACFFIYLKFSIKNNFALEMPRRGREIHTCRRA